MRPFPKPELHTAGEDTDYFIVKLDAAEAEQIVEYLLDAEVGGVGLNGETTPEASHASGLVDAWVRYVDFCDEAAI